MGEIHLKGHWLIEARFEINAPVKVRIRDKFLVVIHDT
ncbi:SymE family type I addiction module toxin [Agarilytica rhodophyticola]